MRHFFHQAIFLSAKGSLLTTLGYWAMEVNVWPKVVLIFTIELMAQPLAFSRGPRLRLRSLSQARSIEGPEMKTTTAPTSRRMLYHFSVTKPPRVASAPPMAPSAKPMAAKIPANLAMSNIWAFFSSVFFSSGVTSLTVIFSVAASVLAVMSSNDLLSFSSAFLVILSVIQLPNLR